ncbi:MAG: helix-turn-helix domain-containing protein [Candidatus Cryptobacteroides sp.]
MDIFAENISGRFCQTEEGDFSVWTPEGFFSGEAVLGSGSENIVCLMIVADGRVNVSYGGRTCCVRKGCFANFIDSSVIKFSGPSDDLRAVVFCSTDSFMMKLLRNRPPFEASYITKIKTDPMFGPDSFPMHLIEKRMEDVVTIMEDTGHVFQSEMLRCALNMLLMDVGNIFPSVPGVASVDRKMVIFRQFMRKLHSNVPYQHAVGWYAAELCITPQYLNKVVKSLTGKTAYEWVCTVLVGEIVRRLDDTDKPVGVISEECSFPDQATMTNLFKRHMGMSPGQYRKRQK